MKIPNTFIIRIRTNSLGKISTKNYGRKIKDLFDKVPITFSFAKSLYSGGRYSYENQFNCEVKERENYNKEVVEIILFFKKIIK